MSLSHIRLRFGRQAVLLCRVTNEPERILMNSRRQIVTHKRIEINPAIMFGKPVIKGTRITVEQILRKVAGGMTINEILIDHPHLTPDDVYAAVAFAADYLAQEEIILAGDQRL